MRPSILAAISAVLLCAAASSRAERFLGDEALALAGSEWGTATRRDAEERVAALLRHLKADADRLARHRPASSARFIKTEKPVELPELADAILLARKDVRLSTARNLIIIADASVEISFASAVVIIASGPVRLAHELQSPGSGGVYISRSSFEVSHAGDGFVYAIGGVSYSHSSSLRLFNTEPENLHFPVATVLPGRLFKSEPVRLQRQLAHVFIDGHRVSLKGDRCARGMYIDLLEKELASALQAHLTCGAVESVSVRCEAEGEVTGPPTMEHWAIRACGKEIEVISATNAYSRNVSLRRPAAEAPSPATTSPDIGPPELQARIQPLFRAAMEHSSRGELVEARDYYREVTTLYPKHGPALHNLTTLERTIARADAAAAPFTSLIEGGERNADVLADRAWIYLRHGDHGRAIKDFDYAADLSRADPRIRTAQVEGYLRADRPEEVLRLASGVLRDFPGLARAHELRAWANLLAGRGAEALADARRSLDAERWTRESFATQRAAYRVVVGFLAAHQAQSRQKGLEWLREWVPYMDRAAWPDAFAFYALGAIDYDTFNASALARQKEDRGERAGEAAVFVTMDMRLAGTLDPHQDLELTRIFRESYSAGWTLGWVLYRRASTTLFSRQAKRD